MCNTTSSQLKLEDVKLYIGLIYIDYMFSLYILFDISVCIHSSDNLKGLLMRNLLGIAKVTSLHGIRFWGKLAIDRHIVLKRSSYPH